MLIFVIAAVLYAIDQGIKAAVVASMSLGQTVPVLGEVLQLRYLQNSGAAFSSFSGYTWALTLVALGVIAFVIWFARRIRSVVWGVVFGFVLGGALGNATDRFIRPPGAGQGSVVDYLQVWGFPAVFNIADVWVCTAAALFLILTFRGVRLDGTRIPPRPAAGSPAT
ncbi:MAG: signal peptidase II [Micrococcales bacterium]|nr:signal peptidase II [Micrococcales bacterium]